MATGEQQVNNPIGLKLGDLSDDGNSLPRSPAAFENAQAKQSSFEDENVKLSSFEDENVPGSTDAWGQLAAGDALYTGEIDKAILVRLARAKCVQPALFARAKCVQPALFVTPSR